MGFIRFDTPERDEWSRVGTGIFSCTWDFLQDGDCDIRRQLDKELDWFCENMRAPNRMYYRVCSRAERSGVCWFRDSAIEHVNHGRKMAQLLSQAGFTVRQLRSENPGAKIWQSEHQVVALGDSWTHIHQRLVH